MPRFHLFATSGQRRGYKRAGGGPVTTWRAWVTLPLWLWAATPGAANPITDLKVTAYRGKTEANTLLTREQLRDIFFLRQTKWLNGDPIRVFVLPDQHPLHVRFVKEVLGVYPYQLRSAWDRMVYSGTGAPPVVLESVDEMDRRVDETAGAIGYVEK